MDQGRQQAAQAPAVAGDRALRRGVGGRRQAAQQGPQGLLQGLQGRHVQPPSRCVVDLLEGRRGDAVLRAGRLRPEGLGPHQRPLEGPRHVLGDARVASGRGRGRGRDRGGPQVGAKLSPHAAALLQRGVQAVEEVELAGRDQVLEQDVPRAAPEVEHCQGAADVVPGHEQGPGPLALGSRPAVAREDVQRVVLLRAGEQDAVDEALRLLQRADEALHGQGRPVGRGRRGDVGAPELRQEGLGLERRLQQRVVHGLDLPQPGPRRALKGQDGGVRRAVLEELDALQQDPVLRRRRFEGLLLLPL